MSVHDGYHLLIRDMVNLALRDLKSKREKIRREALAWIFNMGHYSICFDDCCAVLGIEPVVIKERLQRLFAVELKKLEEARKC